MPKPKKKATTTAHKAKATTTKTPAKQKGQAARQARVYREETPIVIPMDAESFTLWKLGRRLVEYRTVGQRFNGTTCTVEREAHLSIGNEKAPRMKAKIKAVSIVQGQALSHIPADQYPEGNPKKVIAIALTSLEPLTKKKR